jgi:cytochrome c biogenesis protein CcmG/thiol:disulfide interchange protein DsbE
VSKGFLVVVSAAALLSTACSTAHHGTPKPVPPAPTPHPSLVARADLDPCPPSTATSGAGGLPDVTLPCLGAGPAVHLSGLRGKPLVLNIWGSWCTPCQKETTYFARVYDATKSKVRFLGVDDEDDPNSALDFAAHVSPPMRYPSVRDDDKAVLLALQHSGPVAVPSTLFVSAAGTVVHRQFAAYTSAQQLRGDIARYLGVH